MKAILFLMMFFPFTGAVLNGILGRHLPRKLVETIACAALLCSLAMAAGALIGTGGESYHVALFQWFGVGDLRVSMDIHYDALAAIMVLMVTFVASIIHLYSVSFMREDTDYVRYFCYLNLFVFFMLVIALADSLIFVYLGWEGVGFCSYALIGFWYGDPIKATAGKKAFIMTRVGDIGFGVAVALLFAHLGTFSITHINPQAASLTPGLATALTLLFLFAAMGKSAQLPLTTWLPDAMAGPTPVSALIHAATMVTAGVYLLMRLFPVVQQSPQGMRIIAGVGAVTAFYAALSALAQRDIKRVLAYSTISQVGYMILAVGAGDMVGGMFHLLSHAFFKSLLFLSAGCVIQALFEEHDIFKMGNLRRHLPGVFWLMLAGALCLSAFPFLGGYFSKDRILLSTFIHAGAAYKVFWALGMAAAFLTALYTFRMFFIAFLERPDGRKASEVRPIPGFMMVVLIPLGLLALSDGLLNLPWGVGKRWLGHFLSSVPGALVDVDASGALLLGMAILSASLSLLGIALAWFLFRQPRETREQGLGRVLFEAFYLDVVYRSLLVRPYRWAAGVLWQRIDKHYLDRNLERFGISFDATSLMMRLWTTGRLSTYLKAFLLGLVGLLGLFVGRVTIW
ncbi:MAG: NADH-quinone oxidoreductase subunit L [Deltaproteobacteria bacterium]